MALRQKVERMWRDGKGVDEIANYFNLPFEVIENMVCEPPKRSLGDRYVKVGNRGKGKGGYEYKPLGSEEN
jgi:hypothetical protein